MRFLRCKVCFLALITIYFSLASFILNAGCGRLCDDFYRAAARQSDEVAVAARVHRETQEAIARSNREAVERLQARQQNLAREQAQRQAREHAKQQQRLAKEQSDHLAAKKQFQEKQWVEQQSLRQKSRDERIAADRFAEQKRAQDKLLKEQQEIAAKQQLVKKQIAPNATSVQPGFQAGQSQELRKGVDNLHGKAKDEVLLASKHAEQRAASNKTFLEKKYQEHKFFEKNELQDIRIKEAKHIQEQKIAELKYQNQLKLDSKRDLSKNVTKVIDNPVIGKPRIGSAVNKSDPTHNFNNIIDNYAGDATKFDIPTKGIGGQVVRKSELRQIEGYLNGKDGVFEWIIDQGNITHRRFIPGGKVTGFPNQVSKK